MAIKPFNRDVEITGYLDATEGVKVNGTEVITSAGAIVGDIQATAGSISAAELADNAITTVKVTDANITADKLATNSVTTVKITDANVTTAKIADANVTDAKLAATLDLSAKTVTVGEARTGSNNGTAATNVTAVEYGDGRNHTTVLTITGMAYTIAGAAAEAVGKLLYTFPAGSHLHEVTAMNVTLQGGGTVNADTPDVGIGSVIATGAVATLNGTATFEDYITGQTATDCSGTSVDAMTGATAGYGTGISLNGPGDSKAVHLNIADTWAGADTVTASGTVIIKWTFIG